MLPLLAVLTRASVVTFHFSLPTGPACSTYGKGEQRSAVSGQWSVVSGQWSVVSGQWSAIMVAMAKGRCREIATRAEDCTRKSVEDDKSCGGVVGKGEKGLGIPRANARMSKTQTLVDKRSTLKVQRRKGDTTRETHVPYRTLR
jgi:hypothetical protein